MQKPNLIDGSPKVLNLEVDRSSSAQIQDLQNDITPEKSRQDLLNANDSMGLELSTIAKKDI